MKQLTSLSPILLLCWITVALPVAAGSISLRVQSRAPVTGSILSRTELIDPARTAVVVIDMWDHHWCKTYSARVANLVPRMNDTVNAARALGMQIVWAPSDVLDFYKDYPQRLAMTAIPVHPEPASVGFHPPQAPQGDNCECGPERPCHSGKAWSRQQDGLIISESDLIGDCNNGRELLNLCAARGIDTLLYLGVASNMCICYRGMGMINMKDHGLKAIFAADLVESIMGNGFNPQTRQRDLNFTPAKGSALVQYFLEQHVAPSIESRQLLTLAGKGSDSNGSVPKIVFVIGDEEYITGETLPAFARDRLGPKFQCTFLHANPTNRNDIPGLSALYDADLLVLSARRRFLPVPQMDHLERFIRAGKPLVAIRVSCAPFAEGAGLKRQGDGLVVWQNFDEDILGCHYNLYDPAARKTGSDVRAVPAAHGHPLLWGFDDLRFHSSAWIYRVSPLAAGTTELLRGRWSDSQPEEPVAWTRILPDGGRVFYTSLGHPDDFKLASFKTLLANAIQWALDRKGGKL